MKTAFEGVVLSSISYKEKSKIVYLYTPNGMESILVPNGASVSSNRLGFTTTLNRVSYSKTSSAYPKLIEYSVLEQFYDFHQDLEKIQIAMIMIQVIKALEEDAPHHRIYPFWIQCLNLLKKRNPLYVLSLFLCKMLAVFGVRPEFESCVRCGNREIVNFSIAEGGSLCRFCSTFSEENTELKNALRLLYNHKEYEKVLDLDDTKILTSLYEYYQIHVHLTLKPYHIDLQ